ncbi:MAG TPA: GNAT family N-acetyltransferase [Feifaniaceae bacterium]|nr:GNAT family N-acetyltransferase [Feifaniaceae bacterium]
MNGRAMDIHFVPQYVRAYEAHEGGKVEVFDFAHALGEVRHIFLRRSLSGFVGFEGYSDIITPYGYGGPVITRCEKGGEGALCGAYRDAFDRYCAGQRIVCAFTRFHPIFKNDALFSCCYDEVSVARKIVIIDLDCDVYRQEFSRSARRAVCNAENNGVRVAYDPGFERLEDFLEIYYSTMKKNGALRYYYFDGPFFERLIRDNPGHVFLAHACKDERIIASSLFLGESGIEYGQFCGTREGCYAFDGYTAILARYAMDAAAGGSACLVLGGGTTGDAEDPILNHKKKFSRSLHDFCVGKRIYDRAAYEALCQMAGVTLAENKTEGFFPAYRTR